MLVSNIMFSSCEFIAIYFWMLHAIKRVIIVDMEWAGVDYPTFLKSVSLGRPNSGQKLESTVARHYHSSKTDNDNIFFSRMLSVNVDQTFFMIILGDASRRMSAYFHENLNITVTL